ncbi:MAG: NAD-dependent epimerase/dehydratase family protein [Candidatus Omnitrophota bacterium]
MKVLVTGGCGFIGSHVCEYYRNKNAKVIAYDNLTKHELARTGYNTKAAREYNENFLKKIGATLLVKDIRDYSSLKKAAKGCDYIIHTAAQPAMTISWEDPVFDFTTNCLGTLNVLETARYFKIPVVACATVHVYGNKINDELKEGQKKYLRNPECIDEQYPTLQGTLTPLHASKGAMDIYVKTYIDTFKLEAASFRLTGLYGPRQFGGEDHGWVANFAIRAATGKPLSIYGSGKQVRDILFATDLCEAFDAFYRTRKSGIYNIGGSTKTAISLLECVDIIEKLTGERPHIKFGPDRLGDLRYFVCDITKAYRELGWIPRVVPEQGIKVLLDWINAHPEIFKVKK